MKQAATTPRQFLLSIFVLVAPAIAALCYFALADYISWQAAVIAALLLSIPVVFVLRLHFRRIAALEAYIIAFGAQQQGKDLPMAPREGSDLMLGGLSKAIIETARERQRRRQELEAAIASNNAILGSLPDPLITLDGERRIVWANDPARELFGDSVAGRDLLAVLRTPVLIEAVDTMLREKSEGRTQFVGFTVPGTLERVFTACVVPLPAPARDGALGIVSFHDVTSQRRAEQLRADFVANASHELRTPLASLLGFIETLQGPARRDEEARENFLAIMHDQASRMRRLVEDLLSLSRIEMDEHTIPGGFADLDSLLAGIVRTLEAQARSKGISIRVECRVPGPIPGDRDNLAQVFQNLMDNAVKYGRPDSQVRVIAEPSAQASRRLGRPAVAISIIDQGEGIAREHLPRLTERFYRVDTARSRALGGTGLGLAIVKHIVNRHRGALDIESTPGEGSRFSVYLPTGRPERTPSAAGQPTGAEPLKVTPGTGEPENARQAKQG